MEHLHPSEPTSPGYLPANKPRTDFEEQAAHARDFADQARATADKAFGNPAGTNDHRSAAPTSDYGSPSPDPGGSRSRASVSPLPGSSAETAARPRGSGHARGQHGTPP